MTVWRVVAAGFDFPYMEVRAICTTKEAADRVLVELQQSTPMFPWNGWGVIETECDVVLPAG